MSLIGFRRARLMRLRAALLIGLALLTAAIPHAVAGPTPSAEYQLHAAFLYKLSQSPQWPDRASGQSAAPPVNGPSGDDPSRSHSYALVPGEKLAPRPPSVRSSQPPH